VSGSLACRSCGVSFDAAADHRAHFRSDLHRFNLKRKLKELPTVTQAEFDAISASDRDAFFREV
jgi:pre-60S factor REI1